MLFKELDKLKRSAVMTTIVLMFFGFFLLLLPEEYIPYLGSVLGFFLLVLFALSVFIFIGSKKALIHYIMLSLGLLFGLFGTTIFLFEGLFVRALFIAAGLVPIIAGLYGIWHAFFFARYSRRKGWWVLVIRAVIMILFGGCVFFTLWTASTGTVVKVIGGTMVFSALVSALRLIWIWPLRNEEK